MLRPTLALAVLLVPIVPIVAPRADAQSPTATCIAGARKISHISNSTRNADTELTWREGECEVRIRMRGDVRFTDDYRTIAGLGRDGSVRIDEEGTVERELDIRPGEGGALRYSYQVAGREQPFDAAGQAWLESIVLQLFRRSAYRADERVQWMLRTRGAEGTLAEIGQMDGDYGSHAYSAALLKHASGDAALQARVLETAAGWKSDYYKSELLEALVDKSGDAAVTRAGWKVVGALESDYYATKGMRRLLAVGTPGAAELELALGAVDGIESDYYRAEVLQVIARAQPLEGRLVPLYLKAAERSESDYYRAEMLAALVARAPLSAEHLLGAIRATSSMASDYYRTQSLVRIARKHDLTGDALAAYTAAASGIDSKHYRGEALDAVRRGGAGAGTSR